MAGNREIFAKVKKEYETKKINAIADAEARKAAVHAKYPDIRAIDAELRMTGVNIMNEALKGKIGLKERMAALENKNIELQKERARLLEEHGLAHDCTDVKYECKQCSDTGYVGLNMCSCFKKAVSKLAFESSGLGELLSDQSFDTFDMSFYLDDKNNFERMKKTVEKCKAYADAFNGRSNNLILLGPTGLGKTHLSTSMAKVIIEKGYEVVYDSAPNIFNDFNKEQFKNESGLTERFFDCDLLILDDLGTEMHTAFTVSCLYNIINTRLNSGKSTIINSNLTLEELRKLYTDRITSRIFGYFEPLTFAGKDIRLQKLQRNF